MMKNKKYFFSCLAVMFTLCIFFSFSAFAAEEKGVSVSVEYNENLNILKEMGEMPKHAIAQKGYVDLSDGNDYFTIGKLDASEAHTTDTYGITKSKIRINLQSLQSASPHIKVTLYKPSGTSVATTTVSVPVISSTGDGGKTITFSNLDSAFDYYAIIANMDSKESGNLIGMASQA